MYRAITVSKHSKAVPAIAVFSEDIEKSIPKGVPSSLKKAFKRGLSQAGFKAGVGETIMVDNALLIGCGAAEEFTADQARIAGARTLRTLDRMGVKSIEIMTRGNKDAGFAARSSRAFSEGMGLANWRLKGFDGTASQAPTEHGNLKIHAERKESLKALHEGLMLAEAANEARRVAATPPNVCNPAWMAKESRKAAKKLGLTCKVIDQSKATYMGMGGIANVGKGSKIPPCLIQLEYKPSKVSTTAKDAHLVIVGKTITYDTGGYSLKISNSMRGMKYDMCGGAAVFGAMHAIAKAKLPIKVTALLPAAENMVSDIAYRPDDVITMYNGVTVEVTNTDAEGRLVLGDALAYACKKLKPSAIVDMATLTGGVVVALGNFSAGLWCNDDAFRSKVDTASEHSGEKVWQLPLWQEHRDFMRSKFADILNSNPQRLAHPIQGAAFLSYFVDENIPWAHIDIAGMSNLEANEITGHGATGFGVRLLHDLARTMS